MAAKASISGGDDGLGAAAGGHQDAGVVDYTDLRDPVEVVEGLAQEDFGFKTGKARVVLEKQQAAVGQHQ